MKAIKTSILYATNTKPTRIKVQAEGVPHIVVGRDSLEGTEEEQHRRAAFCLCEKYGWGFNLVSGGLPTPGQWVHCFVPKEVETGNIVSEILKTCEAGVVTVMETDKPTWSAFDHIAALARKLA